MIIYREGNNLRIDEVIELYQASTLGKRRPINERDQMTAMISNANLVVTAWEADLMVGIARSITDYSFVTYLSDLAVRVSHQRKGIGKELMRRTQLAGGAKTMLLLLAAPEAEKYYPHVGFTQITQAWLLRPGESIK